MLLVGTGKEIILDEMPLQLTAYTSGQELTGSPSNFATCVVPHFEYINQLVSKFFKRKDVGINVDRYE